MTRSLNIGITLQPYSDFAKLKRRRDKRLGNAAGPSPRATNTHVSLIARTLGRELSHYATFQLNGATHAQKSSQRSHHRPGNGLCPPNPVWKNDRPPCRRSRRSEPRNRRLHQSQTPCAHLYARAPG